MDQFPNHIFDKILTKLSVSKLLSLRRVNRRFLSEINRILSERRNLWRDAAQSDLSPSVFSLFLEKLFPSITSDYSKITDEEWQHIYLIRQKWKQCSFNYLNNFHLQTLVQEEFLNGHVTSIQTYDNYIAVGTDESRVYIYKDNHDGSRYQFLFKVSSHENQFIVKFIFWRPDKKKIYIVMMSEDNQLTFWDLNTQKEVINRKTFPVKNLCTSSDSYFYTEYHGTIIFYEFKFAIVGKKVNKISFDTHNDRDDQYPVELISTNKNVKIIWPLADKINILEHYDNITLNSRLYSVKIPTAATRAKNIKYYLLSLENSKSIILIYDDILAVHQGGNEWLEIDMLEMCQGRISSLLLHGDVLIFSVVQESRREFIRIYSSEKFFQCTNHLNFYELKSRDNNFIYSDIIDIKPVNDNNGPCLAVATKNFIEIQLI